MRNWLLNGNPNCYWLSGFFFPQGFITGVLQTHARKYEIAIDKLSFSFRVLDFEKDQLQSRPAVISHLFLADILIGWCLRLWIVLRRSHLG